MSLIYVFLSFRCLYLKLLQSWVRKLTYFIIIPVTYIKINWINKIRVYVALHFKTKYFKYLVKLKLKNYN